MWTRFVAILTREKFSSPIFYGMQQYSSTSHSCVHRHSIEGVKSGDLRNESPSWDTGSYRVNEETLLGSMYVENYICNVIRSI